MQQPKDLQVLAANKILRGLRGELDVKFKERGKRDYTIKKKLLSEAQIYLVDLMPYKYALVLDFDFACKLYY